MAIKSIFESIFDLKYENPQIACKMKSSKLNIIVNHFSYEDINVVCVCAIVQAADEMLRFLTLF